MATIRDVARESGVSVATVSYVLNNGPRTVAPATRDRVLDVVRRMNYHPHVLGFLASLLALTPAAGVPVALRAPSAPAPVNVTLAWTSEAHTAAVISWEETGDVRNKIDIVGADGSPTFIASQFAEAGQPNQVPMFPGLSDASYRVVVRVVDAAGTELSDPARSPEFDTDREPPPVMKSVVPREDGSIRMTWEPTYRFTREPLGFGERAL